MKPLVGAAVLSAAWLHLLSGCSPVVAASGDLRERCIPIAELVKADAELTLALESAKASDLVGVVDHSTLARKHEESARQGIGPGNTSGGDAETNAALVSTVVAMDQAASVFFDSDVRITKETESALAKLAEVAHGELIHTQTAISRLGTPCP